ncbi:hypothetical protein J2W37_005966 [Variovorax paradoxus]|uniref:Uncharacterized protein n=1 Tax=Variovorax paradoxus TaxID=34073 RepID=A0AAE3Y3B1_VARPD|nr:hypothetical protein [Variovorax paradoxus]MDP9968208.1 hypothetical protein [Variovorax paradoxus]MDR6429715.1 hypothetical protein [Variovorax paradoxus]
MSIPVNASVRAVPNLLVCLHAARSFMEAQDDASAPARFKKLQAEVVKARALLSFAPTSGRPARFLDAKSGWGQFQAEQARQTAEALGLPVLRELVLARHVLLYAHSEKEVVLLSLRHERQLGDGLPWHPV